MATELGRVEALWRYPIKSFRGELLEEAEVTPNGLAGDRAYALRDRATGRVMSAKRTARLLEGAARYPEGPGAPPEIVLPGGRTIGLDDASDALSAWLERDVELVHAVPDALNRYEIAVQTIADIEAGVDQLTIEVGDFPSPPGAFFDAAPLHLLTDATLAAFRAACPEGRFDARRFRPNVFIASNGVPGYVEEAWTGRTIAIGGQVRAAVSMDAIRCVMTTLPQDGLPRDPRILRAVVRNHGGTAGVYAGVEIGGTIRVGDPVALV